MGPLIVLSVVAAGAAGVWATQILRERQRKRDALARQEHEDEIAALVVMAMFADGELTTDEWAVIRREFGARGYSLLETDRVIGELKDDALRARDAGQLDEWVAARGNDLSVADRELVYEMVVELSLSGSRLEGPHGAYLDNEGRRETLLGLFGDGLGIDAARQREINLAHLRARDASSS